MTNSGGVLRSEFEKIFHMRDMTNQQIMDTFDTADIDKNGKLSIEEWDAFYDIFITPQESCLMDEN